MDEFARRSAEDRRAYIQEAANSRDLTRNIIEKDFWVCWTLRRLVSCKDLSGQLMFKGGTSLSKSYNIIHRFSEDIDLTIAKDASLICDVPSLMEDDISSNERQRRSKALKQAAQEYVREILMPILKREIEMALSMTDGWEIVADPDDPDAQTLLFNYPKTSGYGLNYGNDYGGRSDTGYIKPRIKLEFGARGDTEPFEMKTIVPYLAEEFPDELLDAGTEIPTLAATRTFWEKVTILHALYHNGKLRDGMSRHYYDTLMLARAGIAAEALSKPELLAQVVRNKSLMFADKSASYDTALMGTLRLSPSDAIVADLRRDYANMAEMFMAEPPSFTDLLSGIAELEETVNSDNES